MAITGTVDSLVGRTLSGWASGSQGDDPILIRVTSPFGTQEVAADLPRADLAGPAAKKGFRVTLPGGCTVADLASGALRVEAIDGGAPVPLGIWAPLLEAAKLETLDYGRLAHTLRFLDPAKRLELQQAASAFLRPWPRSAEDHRKLACVIAYANDSNAWFPYFHRYYGDIVGPDALFVITQNPDAFKDYALGGVISLAGFPFDDGVKAQMVSRLAQGLLATYRWTIVCDVDEIIIPYPGSGKSFTETLAGLDGDVSVSRGFDVLHMPDEDEFDFSKAVLAQRRWGIANSAMCKPHVARQPVNWSGGFHYCDRKPRFEPRGSGFVTLHLKWACRRVRKEVAGIAQRTRYADPFIAKYAVESVSREVHPRLAANPLAKDRMDGPSMEAFEKRYMEKLGVVPDRGMWIGEHFPGDALIDLWDR